MSKIIHFPGSGLRAPLVRASARYFGAKGVAPTARQLVLRFAREPYIDARLASAKAASAGLWELAEKETNARVRAGWTRLAQNQDERVVKLLTEKAALTTQQEFPECGHPQSDPAA